MFGYQDGNEAELFSHRVDGEVKATAAGCEQSVSLWTDPDYQRSCADPQIRTAPASLPEHPKLCYHSKLISNC